MAQEKKTLVALVGAGASTEAGIPGTSQLGEFAKRALPMLHAPGVGYGNPPFRLDQTVPMAEILDSALRGDYPNYDFEIILHALERLEAFASRYTMPTLNRPILKTFAEIMRRYDLLCDSNVLWMARQAVIKEIHSQVGSACDYPIGRETATKARQQINRMFCELAKTHRLIIVDFNYDDLIDRVAIGWEDGFMPDHPKSEYLGFSPADWNRFINDPNMHLLMHVHGSVHFGYKRIGADLSAGSLSEPVKYRDIRAAHESVVSISTSGTRVEGEIFDAGVIISGSGKAGKIAYNTRPYGYYHRAAAEFFSKASQLLVLGYSWRDEHINTWVNEMIDLRPERRTAVVTKRTGKDVGDNTALEYQRLSKLAGYKAWQWLDNKAYQDPNDPDQPRFFQRDNFAIAPGGFILDDDVETDLLQFLMR